MMEFTVKEVMHVETPLFRKKHTSKYNLFGISEIFNITNSKYLDFQM